MGNLTSKEKAPASWQLLGHLFLTPQGLLGYSNVFHQSSSVLGSGHGHSGQGAEVFGDMECLALCKVLLLSLLAQQPVSTRTVVLP